MPKRRTHDEFVAMVKDKNRNIEILGKYFNSTTKIKCKCNIDGNIWDVLPYSLLAGQGCPVCGMEKVRIHGISRRKTHDMFVKEMSVKNPNIVVVGEYETSNKKILCRCKIDGTEWMAIPNDLISKGSGCPVCGQKNRSKSMRHSDETFLRRMKDTHPELTAISKYNGMNHYITVMCNVCGMKWDTKPNNLLNNRSGCPNCNISKGESYICNELNKMRITYKQQYKFTECADLKPLPFDFAVISKCGVVGLIEFDGEQHFYPIEYFGGKDRFDITKKHDKIKSEFASAHNIPLLRCNYKQSTEELSSAIKDFINMIL